jgi:hypothetical protein
MGPPKGLTLLALAVVGAAAIGGSVATQSATPCLPTYRATRDRVPPETHPDFVDAHGTGDFNHDGLLDVVYATLRFASDVQFPISILLNTGQGAFVDRTSTVIDGHVPTLYHPRRLAVADFNGDGFDDVFFAAHGQDVPLQPGERNALLLSQPDGRLHDATATLPDVKDFTHALAVGDIDRDGDLDVFVGNFKGSGNSYPLSYFLVNDGRGLFTPDTSRVPAAEQDPASTTDGPPGAAALVDLDGDRWLDLVIGDHGGHASRVYLNDGRGSFPDSRRMDLPLLTMFGEPADVVDLVSDDIDGDGLPDLVLSLVRHADYFGRRLQLLTTHRDGGLRFVDESDRLAAADFPAVQEAWYQFLQLLDFDKDGNRDIVALSLVSGADRQPRDTPFVLLNVPGGRFAPKSAEMFGSRLDYFGPLERVDLRRDGTMDFLGLGYQFELYEQIGCGR